MDWVADDDLPNGKNLYHNGRWHGSNAVFARFEENATMIHWK
jgi:hypothetical protein